MALPVLEKLDGARAIVIEDVPPGTAIGDLIGAFSPFGAIQFASVGPPAVVSFEREASAARALLVASMKSVSLLGAFRDKKQPVPPPAPPLLGASPETVEIGPNEASAAEAAAHETKMCQVEAATAASPAEAAAGPKKKSSPNEAAKAMLVSASDGGILDLKKLERYMDDILQIQDRLVENLKRVSDRRLQSSLHGQSYRRGRIAAEVATRGLNTKPE
jgi:hypothetical protein